MHPARDLGRNPLFQIFFNMLDVPAHIELEGLEVRTLGVSDVESKFDLTVYASDTPAGTGLHGFITARCTSRTP